MKRTSIIGSVFVTAIALFIPMVAWGQVNSNVANNPDVTDTMTPNHRGTHHGSHGNHGGCW